MHVIETEYKGYKFRSRLEARWAVFLDALGIEWKYEAEGYELGEYRYLPDFWLPRLGLWAEVKGDPDGLRKDFDRMRAILGPKSPLPGFATGETAVMLLGDIPELGHSVTVLHPCLARDEAGPLCRSWGYFVPAKGGGHQFLRDHHQSWLYLLFGIYCSVDPGDSADSHGWNPRAHVLDTPGAFSGILDAYKGARQARFEHGANGQ